MLPQKIQLLPSDRRLDEIMVLVEAPDEELFQDVKEKLKHFFAMFYIQEKAINLVHLGGVAGSRSAAASAWFGKYEGVLVKHLSDYQESSYVLCCDYSESCVDDKESASLEHPGEESKYFSVEWVTHKLQRSLERLQSEQNQNLQGKLEVRLGKKIWHSLPDEVLENDKRISPEDLLNIGSKYQCAMNTCVDPSKIDKVSRELKDLCDQRHSVEIFNFILTLPDADGDMRKRVNVQVMAMESGELKIIRVVKNDYRVVAFDVMCLHRQLDFRLNLDRHEIIHTCDPEFIVIKKLVESMSLAPGTLTFTPCNDWKVDMLRYIRQSTFILEDTFMVTISDVKECSVNWERNEGEQFTVNLEDSQDKHWELELSSILWVCSFANDIGQTPEEALSLYMEYPSLDPTVKTKMPDLSDPETFISQQDLHSILEKVDWLSEQLG
ncbi:hypothetical protein EMCRGX_G006479 [Ephydatia muelleri]